MFNYTMSRQSTKLRLGSLQVKCKEKKGRGNKVDCQRLKSHHFLKGSRIGYSVLGCILDNKTIKITIKFIFKKDKIQLFIEKENDFDWGVLKKENKTT